MPGLGLAPDLGEHLVIAPYAAALALVVAPREACANLARLERLGYLSSHGFYDAIDYTAKLRRPGSPAQPCKIVMAHHSGMTLLALTHALLGPTMPQRFLRNPSLRRARHTAAGTRAAERVSGGSGNAPSGPAPGRPRPVETLSRLRGAACAFEKVDLHLVVVLGRRLETRCLATPPQALAGFCYDPPFLSAGTEYRPR